jgi:hypothetical protein
VAIDIRNCTIVNCLAAIGSDGDLDGLNVDGLFVYDTPRVVHARGRLLNSTFRRVVHHPHSPGVLCWCNSGREWRHCHGTLGGGPHGR